MLRPRLHLASASPRRLALLREVGLDVVPCPAPVDETPFPGEDPVARVARLAEAKVAAAAARLGPLPEGAVLLGADTTVVLDGVALDKPEGPEEASAILRRLAGRTHEVWTGVHVRRPGTGTRADVRERTRVRLRSFGEDAVAWYVASGEPLDKAGAYGIQGLGVFLVEGIEGSWSNVVGLPLERLPEMMRTVGIRFPF
ncbi:MAG TPA: Maf family protein [Candidatus Polarisedimenticolaceae bacterium]|nr:Maf family protein [Candidatus Polarisedimenticolaceae bacterium]